MTRATWARRWMAAGLLSVSLIAAAGRLGAQDVVTADPESRDVLGQALGALGATRADLGYRPHASWSRYPSPSLIPYKLPFFDDVFAEPLRLYALTRTMGNTAQHYLAPGAFDSEPQALHKLVYFLGIDKRIGGFRDYSVNLPDSMPGDEPLLSAIEAAYTLTGQNLEARSFGKAGTGLTRAALQRQIAALPVGLQIAVARLVAGLVDASRWQRLAIRNVPPAALQACWRIRDLGETQGDALVYYPQIDDVARNLDEASLAYAAMKTVQAAQDARTALRDWLREASSRERAAIRDLAFTAPTPLGRVVVGGIRDDIHAEIDVLALVDLGGADTYRGSAGASSSLEAPISVCLDLEGNDTHECDDLRLPSQGTGVFGAGVLLDVAGDDQYQARTLAQGAGFFGVGVLVDEAGKDRYRLGTSGQGCGFFGVGLCLDVQGDDDYAIDGDGQGFGGVGGGVGVLADHTGRDHYMAEPYAVKVNRADYHSQDKVNVSNAQGVGSGRRGDGADGHSWAGGLGAILDLHGNDTYESGNWSLGTGYWFGTGVAYDASGDDLYRSVYFTQAAGAHYANGTLVDEAGNDQHVLYETAGAAMAFGWDYANALLVDKQGDDRYEAKIISLGLADIRSNALFFDLGGDDQYQLGKDQPGMGAADYRDDYKKPDPLAPYNSETACFGLLVDAGGIDRYLVWDEKAKRASPSDVWGNDRSWQSPAPGSPEHGWGNHGLGLDADSGTVPEFVRFDAPAASPTSSR